MEMNLIPRLLITLFLIAAAVPLVTLQDGNAAADQQQSQSHSSGNAPENKFRRVGKPLRDQYIVVLKDNTRPEDVEFVANQLLARHHGNTRSVYRHTIKGFSIQMTEAAAMALSEESRAALRERIRVDMPIAEDGSISLVARAWAVRGER